MLWTQQQAIAYGGRLRHRTCVTSAIQHSRFLYIAILCLYKSERYSFTVIGLPVVKAFIYGATLSLNCNKQKMQAL
ncbi:hypothetical protein IQ274_30095 [Nostoc sp. LEGE 12447]|nr:hypothetical protein [Nostoc sp. LEGE 12447]